MAFAVASCTEEEIVENKVVGKPGEEVKFSLSLNKDSRTVYGDETNGTFPIYWVDGDKVQVFSPQCLEGRRNAEYVVSTKDDEGNVVTNQNYASNLTKTGDYGVQWGEGYAKTVNGKEVEGFHDFYSIYPSGNYEFSKVSKEDGSISMVASRLRVKTVQEISYVNGTYTHDMSNCLMYATTPEVNMEDGVVNLSYNPLSTVLWFELKAADAPVNATANQIHNFTIFGISLEETSETSIAGTFNFGVSNGTVFSWETVSKEINVTLKDKSTSNQGSNYVLEAGGTIDFPIFMAPVASDDISELKITIHTSQGSFAKTIETTGNTKLQPGKIHKIKLPELDVENAEEWDVSTWMKYIPRNVYLSEVSIPGTWNSLNPDFQLKTSLDEQYKLGVRAYHLDTRWSTTQSKNGLGILGEGDVDMSKVYLATADGSGGFHIRKNNWNLLSTSYGQMMNPDTESFATRLGEITANVKPDEYMVVFCTFAQESYNGSKCPKTWYKAISDACDANDAVFDASKLNENTVVGDVLNHVIVVVNLDESVSSVTLPSGSKCLFTYVPMKLPSDHYASTTDHTAELYYSSKSPSGISMYTSHAQISTTNNSAVDCDDRGYSHPLSNRDNLVTSIWDWSKANTSSHNMWMYLGLGGYILNRSSADGSDYAIVENRYAPMIYNRINSMGENGMPYYPMGIILMNNKKGSKYTDSNSNELGYGFSDVCKHILMLNNKYTLQYDSEKSSDYVPDPDGVLGEEGGEA